MSYGFSTRTLGVPMGAVGPTKYIPLSQFFLQQQGKGGKPDPGALYGRQERGKRQKPKGQSKGLSKTLTPQEKAKGRQESLDESVAYANNEEKRKRVREGIRLDEKKLSDLVAKNKWIRLSLGVVSGDKELNKELFDLIQMAYKPLGGHLKIIVPGDLTKEATFIMVVDVDQDPYADAVLLGRQRGGKIKLTAMGQDGSSVAKKAALGQWAKQVGTSKAFAEVSGPIAHILLTKFGASSVGSEDDVKKMLGKPIQWVGAHPSGKYLDHPHWYLRKIGGEEYLKIMVGKGRSRTESVTTTVNVPTVPVPIGVGDGREFLDWPWKEKRKKRLALLRRIMSVNTV